MGERELNDSYVILFLLVFIPLGILLANGVISDAYLPVLLPTIFILIAIFLSSLFQKRKLKYITIAVIIIISVTNIYSLISTEYFTSTSLIDLKSSIFPIKNEEEIILRIERYSGNKPFALTSKGFYPQSTDNYIYLAEWMGAKYLSTAKNIYVIQPTKYDTAKSTIIYRSDSISVIYRFEKTHSI